MLHINRMFILLLLVALILSACRPIVRPEATKTAAPRYRAPTVLVHGAQIRSPNGIKAGPDGNLYVASVNEQRDPGHQS